MTPDFFIGSGDAPIFSTTLVDADGNPVLIQGAALTMTMTSIRGGDPLTLDLLTNPVVNDDDGSPANRGKLHRQFASAETQDVSGLFLVKIIATQGGKPITFPNDGFLFFEVGPTATQTQSRYIGVEELKNSISLSGTSFADEELPVAIEAASAYLEDEYNDHRAWTLGSPGEVRFYTRTDDWEFRLGDAIAITSVDLDYSTNPFWERDPSYGPTWGTPIGWGGGSFSTNLPSASYRLTPIQNGLVANGGNGQPYKRLELIRGSQVFRLPSGRGAIRVTGTFGWETVPSGVKIATSMIATRLMKRMRDAPFGVVAFGGDQLAVAVRQIGSDPDIRAAMQPVTMTTTRLFA